jgi:hypothetical protein
MLKRLLSAFAIYQLAELIIRYITTPSKPKIETWYDENLQFGISIGEYCKSCNREMTLHNGGFEGKPVLCPECLLIEIREDKLKKLNI